MLQVSAVDIEPRAQAALWESPVPELRALEVLYRGGQLLLWGRVSSFYHKQLAQEAVRAVCRHCEEAEIELVNCVEVE